MVCWILMERESDYIVVPIFTWNGQLLLFHVHLPFMSGSASGIVLSYHTSDGTVKLLSFSYQQSTAASSVVKFKVLLPRHNMYSYQVIWVQICCRENNTYQKSFESTWNTAILPQILIVSHKWVWSDTVSSYLSINLVADTFKTYLYMDTWLQECASDCLSLNC